MSTSSAKVHEQLLCLRVPSVPGPPDHGRTFPLPQGAAVDALAVPQFFWLVCTTKVYSGVGADIVMESITFVDLMPVLRKGF